MSHRVVFFGNERLVSGLKHTDTPILRGLIEHGYDVAAIVASHTEATSRSARSLEVAHVANEHNIPLLTPHKPGDIVKDLKTLQADFAVLSAYGRIIPQRIIDVFSPIGIINIHPSLLPRHRGPTPIETTILGGDTQAGVSIMQLTAGMDAGPVYGQAACALDGTETKFALYEKLSVMGANLLFELLPSILDGSLTPKPQQNYDVSYTTLMQKLDGIINPATDTAEHISRKVRAYLGYPKTRLAYHGYDVILTSVKSIDQPLANELVIPCKDNTHLLVESLIAPNGKTMSGSAYLRGLANRP